MSEHFTRTTESVTRWCNKCGRPTQFAVSNGRLGRCIEHEAGPESETKKSARRAAEARGRQKGFGF